MQQENMLHDMVRQLTLSVILSAVVPFILNQTGFLSGSEGLLFSILMFMGSQMVYFCHKTLDVNKKSISMEKSINTLVSTKKTYEEIRPNLWAIDDKMEQAIKLYDSKYRFIIDFYSKQITIVRDQLESIIEKGLVTQVPTSTFSRSQYGQEIFGVFDHKDKEGNYTNNHYYAVISCEGANEWFGQRSIAKEFLTNIDVKVKERRKLREKQQNTPPLTVKRVLIYEPKATNWIERDIFFQLHREAEYDVALISREEFDNVQSGAYAKLKDDFGIFGNAFVWESNVNEETKIKEGTILLNNPNIQKEHPYTTFFNNICSNSKDKYEPHQTIIDYCKGKNIYDFKGLIKKIPPEIEKLRDTIKPPPEPT